MKKSFENLEKGDVIYRIKETTLDGTGYTLNAPKCFVIVECVVTKKEYLDENKNKIMQGGSVAVPYHCRIFYKCDLCVECYFSVDLVNDAYMSSEGKFYTSREDAEKVLKKMYEVLINKEMNEAKCHYSLAERYQSKLNEMLGNDVAVFKEISW